MKLSPTLHRYFARQFLVNFLIVLSVFLAVAYLFDTVELIRRASKRQDISFVTLIEMSFLKLPQVGQQLFSFSILFSAMLTFWRLTRSNELIVVRAAGISAWRFLVPALIVAVLIGGFKMAVVNPASSVLVARFEQLENEVLRGRTSSFDISENGLWLRQLETDRHTIIHARSMSPGGALQGVKVFFFGQDDSFGGRIDAHRADLRNGYWEVADGWLNRPEGRPEFVRNYRIETDISFATIEDSLASPDTLSFWYMPKFIRTMEATGFPAVRLRLYYQTLLAQPALYVGLILLAASVSLRPPRRGGTLILIGTGVLIGFCLFFLTDVVHALGLSETIPIELAAWTPAGISVLLGMSALLQSEDG
jgi:lipopolysaccharide export system permease protein